MSCQSVNTQLVTREHTNAHKNTALLKIEMSDEQHAGFIQGLYEIMVLLIPENLGQLRSPQAAVKMSLKLLDEWCIYFCPFQQQLG